MSGKTYLDELKSLHRGMLRTAHVVQKRSHADGRVVEALGFPLTYQLVADLENINLLSVEKKPAAHILFIRSHPDVSIEVLRSHLETLGAQVEYLHLPSPQLWQWNEDFGKILVPHQTLQSIVRWAAEVYA